MPSRKTMFAVGFILLLCGSLTYAFLVDSFTRSCGQRLGVARVSRFELQSVHFNGITKFRLPGYYFPNGITVAQDGSAWFGEQDVPGLGRLFQNGTMIEYSWPFSYSPSTTSIWGVAEWGGRIWASDALGGQIVILDPATSTVSAVKLGNPAAFPYMITIGQDVALWFTELYGSKLGRIDSQCQLTEYPIPTRFGGIPTQIQFQNATQGYYADAGNVSSRHSEILMFNVKQFEPTPIGGNFRPRVASSIALASNGLWVVQHAYSNLAYYNFQSNTWSQFPTTPVGYVGSTLPYFVAANGSLVWFNEHYGNRIGVIDTRSMLLTEYSLSNPPANKTAQIDNALTFALGKDKVWFTELTANYIGYVDAAYKPAFTVRATERSLELRAGHNTNATFEVSGVSAVPLQIAFADSENYTSHPFRITLNVAETKINSLNGTAMISANIETDSTLAAGKYILLVSVSDGHVDQGVYLPLDVTN